MKILVTGSNGRIGANLVRRLLQQGHEIRGFVFPGDAGRARKLDGIANVELVEGDLRDYAAVQRAVRGVDAVYHIAAAFASPHDNIEYLQINGLGTPAPAGGDPRPRAGTAPPGVRLHRGGVLAHGG